MPRRDYCIWIFPQIAGKLLRFLLLIGQVFGGELFSLLLHRVLCRLLFRVRWRSLANVLWRVLSRAWWRSLAKVLRKVLSEMLWRSRARLWS